MIPQRHLKSLVTPALIELADTTPFSMNELMNCKFKYNLTDFGVEKGIVHALHYGVSLTTAVGCFEVFYTQ